MTDEKKVDMSTGELYNLLGAQIDALETSVKDNQRHRQLSEASWQQVNQLLSEPANPTPALQALMRKNKDDH